MSKEIDERVVEMRFDNQHFEKNVKASMSTIDKLKQSLQFDKSAKSLENLQTAANNLNFKQVENTACSAGFKIQDVWLKLATVFEFQIARKIADSMTRIAKSLTIDPIKTGFQEYETQINSIQTILANTESKGSTLQDVNSALAQLNEYADKTIYNFTEMTRNIGTFTAAGVDLDTSVAAIKGIANLAAVSGSTSQQASTAMYQLSQALSSGTVKLQDWNSVVNAGMGGQVFQDSLKETARVHGIAIDEMIKKHGSFRETLSEGWITSEILTETLSKFTGDLSEEQLKSMGYTEEQIKSIVKLGNTANDAATKVKTFTQLFDTLKEAAQSGWTKSWELLIGDFGEAKGLLTEISDFTGDIIGKSADKRNAMLMGGLSSGWKQLLNEGIHDAARFESTLSVVAKNHGVDIASMVDSETTLQDALKKSLKDGILTSEVLSESISTFTEKVSGLSAKEMQAAGYTAEQIKKLKELDEGVKNGTISMEKFTELIVRPSGRELLIESLWNSIKALESVITPVTQAFEEFFPALNGEQLYNIIEAIRDFTASLTLTDVQSKNLKRTFRGIFAVLDIGVQIIKALAGGFVDLVRYIAPAGNGILSFTGNIGDFLVKLNHAVKSSNIFTKIIKGIGSVLKPIGEVIKTFTASVSDSFDTIATKAEGRLGPLTALGSALKAMFSGLVSVLGKLAPLAGKLAGGVGGAFSDMMSNIADAIQNADYTKIFDIINGGIFSAIGIFIAKFVKSTGDVVENFGEIFEGIGDVIESFSMSIKVEALKKIASALLILAAALLVISLIDSEKLTSSLGAITVLFGELIATLSIFTKISDGKKFNNINKVARAITKLSTALLILAVAMKIMGSMSWNEISVGITGTVVGLGSLMVAVNFLPENKVNKSAKAVKKLASSLVVLAIAMKIMGSMSWKEMGVALITSAVGLGAMVTAVNLLPKNASARAAGMMGLATSLVILGAAFKIIGSMDLNSMGTALFAIVFGLGAMVAAVNLLPKDTAIKTLGMMGLATSLVVLSAALKIMGSMSWDEIARGLAVLAGSLVLIVTAMALMKHALPGAAALLIVAASLAVLTPVLLGLGSMSWGEIARGLVALAGAFVVIGAAAAIFTATGLIGGIIAMSGSIALLGIGCTALGVGVVLLATGITALAAALGVGGVAIVTFVSSMISLIPFAIEQIGIGLISLCNVIAGADKAIFKAFTVILIALVDALIAIIPTVVEGVYVLIESVLSTLVAYAPMIVGHLFDFLIAIINKIAEKLPDLIQAGVNLIVSFFSGVIDALKSIDSEILVKGIIAVGFMSALMLALSAMAGLAPGAMLGVLAVGAVVAELALVIGAIGLLAQIPGLEWLITEGGNFLQKVGTAIGQFIGGIVGGFMSGSTASLPEVATNLSQFITNLMPFIEGVKKADSKVLLGSAILAGAIIALTAADVIAGIGSFITGGSSLANIGTELSNFMMNAMPFIAGASLLTPEMTESVKNLASVILILTAADILNGLTSWLTGGVSFSKWGSELASLGESVRSFAEKLGVLGPEQLDSIEVGAKAIKTIASAANEIPNSGGMAGAIMGENDLDDFTDMLVSAADDITKLMANMPENIDKDVVDKIKIISDVIVSMAEAANEIPNSGGWAEAIAGGNDLDDFMDMLSDSTDGLKDFVDSAKDISEDSINQVNKVIVIMTDVTTMASNIGKKSGKNLKSVGDNLVTFADNFKKFGKHIEKIKAETITNSISKMKELIAFCSSFTEDSVANLSNFGKALEDLATGGIKKFAKVFSKDGSVAEAKKAINTFISNAVNGVKTEENREKFIAVGSYLVEGLAAGIKNNESKVTAAAIAVVEAAEAAAKEAAQINSPSKKFMTLGRYLVEGFANGISSNVGLTEKSMEGLTDDLLKFTQSELEIHSPSVVYDKKVGRYIVQGIAEGITKDMSAEEAMNQKLKNIYGAWEKWKIDNPTKTDILTDLIKGSIGITSGMRLTAEELGYADVYDWLEHELLIVGETATDRYEEAADAVDKIYADSVESIESKIRSSESQHKLDDTFTFDAAKKAEQNKKYLEEQIDLKTQLIDEYNKKIKLYRQRVGDDDLEDAYVLDIKEAINNLQSQITDHKGDLDTVIEDIASERAEEINKEYEAISDRIKDDLATLDATYENWVVSYPDAQQSVKHSRLFDHLNSELKLLKEQEENSRKKFNEIAKLSKSNSKEYKAAYEEWVHARADRFNKEEEISDAHEQHLLELDKAEDRVRESEYQLWQERNRDASEKEILARELKYLEECLVDTEEESAKLHEEYLKILDREGETAEATKTALADWNESVKEELAIRNQIADNKQAILDSAKETQSINYDIAKLKYDIWEKSTGREADDAEKEVKQLEYLNQQLIIQNKITDEALTEFSKNIHEHGSNSIEATRSYKAYLEEVRSLSELKNQILDLEESAADRQKRLKDKQALAQTEYNDYIKKYEKYYLANGMTKADLERDAKLVSGYDPSKIVSNITNKTKTALETVTTSSGYQTLLNNFSDMGTSYINAVNEGITSQTETVQDTTTEMVEKCVAGMLKKRPLWIEAGKYLVEGLVEGIKEERSYAINSVMRLAQDMIKAAKTELDIQSPSRKFAEVGRYAILGLVKGLVDNSGLSDDAASRIGESAIESLKSSIRQIADVVNSDLDTQPTIRPVLDLSNVRSGTARLNAMMSHSQAMAISDSRRARERSDENQNGNETSTNKGNTYQFTQNNYSPKALSRTEIYRQTKNQFAAMKEVLT